MALIVSLRSLDGLEGKSDRILKVTFRGNTQTTSPVASSRFQCYFGQQFQWPVGRPIDEADSLEIRAYNYSKILNNRQIGVLRISLQHLAETGSLDLREHLIDANNAPTNVILDCELRYYSPDSRIGDWQQDDFLYPVDGGVLKDGDGSDFNDDEALEAGGHAEDEADWPADARALLANSADDRLSSLQFEDEAASMLSDGASSLGNEMRKTLEVAAVLDPTLHRMEDFQVSVTIVEARQLSGANINPCVEVRIGDQLKRTDTQMSTNSPYYNQYFAFEFRTTKADLMDQVIHIRAVNKGSMMISRLFAGDLIGEFRLDVRTVYSAPDRMFFQKWACLIDPKDALSGPKGYVKCDINVLGKGEKLKVQPKKTKSSDEEDIEANLLLPIGVPIKRQMADISVIIYRAEGLPKMNTDLMASIKQALAGDSKPLADPYVQVSFAGHSAKTKSIKNSYNPHWNEAIIFTELFPPLCNRIRISLFDWDAVYNECIATHFIDLGQIMNNSENGHLPIFGPSWVNLYGTPRNYNYENMFHPKEELNRGMGEGVAYRGRLLMAIKTEIKQAGGVGGGGGSKAGARVVSAAQVPEAVTGRKEDYLLAGILFDAGAIDANIGKKGKLLTFELSIGTHGNHVDGSFDDASDEDSADEASDFSDSAAGEDSDAELEGAQNRRLLAGGTAVAKEKLRGQRHQWCRSQSRPLMPLPAHEDYYHVPFMERKPCLYIRFGHEDHRQRMLIANILDRLCSEFESGIEEAQELVSREKRGAPSRLHDALRRLSGAIPTASTTVRAVCHGTRAGPRTRLDQRRELAVRLALEKARVKSGALARQLRRHCAKAATNSSGGSASSLRGHLRDCRALARRIRELAEEPQHALPDVFVWLLAQDGGGGGGGQRQRRRQQQRLAFARLPARQVLQAAGEHETGRDCGRVITLFLRKPGRKGAGQSGWTLQCQLKLLLWLGPFREAATSLWPAVPAGYLGDPMRRRRPPSELVYGERTVLEFRAYVFMARNLIGSDESGLSDAFARVVIGDQVVSTHVIPESLSPVWDRTLSVTPLIIYLNEVDVLNHPPVVVVEVFDDDTIGKSEFLGRCFCRPQVTLLSSQQDDYRPPQLDWWEVYRGQLNAGELLASFELVQLDANGRTPDFVESLEQIRVASANIPRGSSGRGDHSDATVQSHHLPVPPSVRPQLAPYRIEVLFWGVRDLARVQLQSVDSPRIEVEFGGRRVWSETIESCRLKPNFPRNLKCLDLMLPVNRWYWPPLMFQCEDSRQFGRTVLVGNHVVPSVLKYIRKDKSERRDKSGTVSSVAASNNIGNRKHWKDQLTAAKTAKTPTAVSSAAGVDNPSFIPEPETEPEVLAGHPAGTADPPGTSQAAQAALPAITAEAAGSEVGQSSEARTLDLAAENGQGTIPGTAMDLKLPQKKLPPSREDLLEMDWWGRFYAAIDNLDDETDPESDSDTDEDILRDIDVEIRSEGDPAVEDNIVDIPVEEVKVDKKKQKKAEKKAKKLRKKRQKLLKKKKRKERRFRLPFGERKDARAAYLAEKHEDDDEQQGGRPHGEDNGWVSQMKLYHQPLEAVRDFGGFSHAFHTFPLYRGKQEDDDAPPESRAVGIFKGNLCVYQISQAEFEAPEPTLPSLFTLHKDLPSNNPVSVLVRVYIVRCVDLHPADPNGKSDPYLILRLGNTTINEKENYIPKQLNPVFGKCFELEAKFPQDSGLQLLVMDWDLLSGDDLIGETRIDLENRLYSRHRATCGLPIEYSTFGYNRWRDQQLPSTILARLCRENELDPPKYEPAYSRVTVDGRTFYEHSEVEDEAGNKTQSNEPLALKVLNNWDQVTGVALVPEHVESRPLFSPEKPGIEQGRVEMWVDLFPTELGSPPPQVDISPRQPVAYELRVIIWDTAEVKLDETDLSGASCSDIFVKGWMKGLGIDEQVTDVHYRSLTGEGNFNWRFIFQFEYLKAEDKIVYKVKDSPFAIDEEERKAPCQLHLQVWDADIVSADDFLGGLDLRLSRLPRGAKSAKACGAFQLERDSGVRAISIFRNRRCRGWWPFIGESEDEPGEPELGGKVDAELQLLTAAEAEANPAGLGRSEPQPLPEPNRPETSFNFLLSPLKALKFLIWDPYKWYLLWAVIIILLAAFLVLFMYSAPGYAAKRLLGA
ncbi:hypothetical protein BOX15_Mlig025810g1 [Macrostomum lignano]|uniref:C2 domain-containing protein n=1 Tax=Macrostomum lignano TaxID=282301 RepID=A0A267FMI5_9PLAT|nr:hypothetical protein BOX15_Mlig025810g1 [Macrostomum lignano]